MAGDAVEDLELRLLLEGIYQRYGYDFREYARSSIRRRVWRRVAEEGLETLSGLQERILHDPACMERLLLDLSINVTSMFRDPSFYAALRETVVPLLATYPFARVWCAGCSSGEEVLSVAILLEEEGLYDRARVYATDLNEQVLARARVGVFPLERMRQYTRNYQRASGRRDFSGYYTAAYGAAQFSRSLLENVVFAQHDLAADGAFNEFHLILCRNVMIYFDKPLQNRVHGLFHESLAPFGVLGLGHKESISFTPYADRYEELDGGQRLYRKLR